MDGGLPKPLKNLQFLGYEVTKYSFVVHKEQRPDQGGHLAKDLDISLEFKDTDLLVNAFLQIDGFSGNEKDQKDKNKKTFSVNIDAILRFSLKDVDSYPSRIKKYEWFFKYQAAVLLHVLTRDIMKDSRFRIANS